MSHMDTFYTEYYKDGTSINEQRACLMHLRGEICEKIRDEGLISVGFHSENAKIYKDKDFMNLMREAFPDGLINENGSVNVGYKADLFMFALCMMRMPTEFEFLEILPHLREEILKQYKALKKPPFKLSAPLMATFMNLPGTGYVCEVKKVALIRPFITYNYNHAGACWQTITVKDLYVLSKQDKFDGIQPVVSSTYSWKSGYSSVAIHEKRIPGDYVGGGVTWREDKQTVLSLVCPKVQANEYGEYRANEIGYVPVDELVAKVFKVMIENKPKEF